MDKQKVIQFVQDQMSKGLSKEDAIRNFAFFNDMDDPVNPLEWFEEITK